MRSFILVTAAALMFASAASAYSPPYRMHQGLCVAPNGQTVPKSLCAPAPHCTAGQTKPCGSTCIPVGNRCHAPPPH
jgi:hypothetical protein